MVPGQAREIRGSVSGHWLQAVYFQLPLLIADYVYWQDPAAVVAVCVENSNQHL